MMSSLSLADLPPLLKERPWLHGVEDNGGESWFCAEKGIVAYRTTNSYTFINVKTDESFDFNVGDKAITKSTTAIHDQETPAFIFSLMRGEENVPWPPSSRAVVTHSLKSIEVGGKSYVDNEYIFDRITIDATDKITFRIDPATKLVESWKGAYGDGVESETKVDYLPSGPEDIYALGVPKDTPVESKILTGEYKDIVDTRAFNRQHLNPYTAYIFRTSPGDNEKRELDSIHAVYRIRRDGLRWLLEHLSSDGMHALKSRMGKDEFAPTKDGNQLVWWKSQAESLRFEPHELSDGVAIYAFKYKIVDGRNQIDYIWPMSSPLGQRDPNPSQLTTPEWTTYPRIYVSQANFDALLNRNPVIGPPQTLMATNGKTGPKSFRIWLDPQRGFAGIRTETEKEDSIYTAVIDKMEQSPNGIWYATRVREGRVNSPGDELKEVNTDKNGKKLETSLVLYLLDFTTPIPDEVFTTKEKVVKRQFQK